MSVIRDLKTNFSSIAWCPVKEHASVMVVANMKDVAPMPSESPKLISLYDWHLENVSESKMLVETQLSAGVCCLNWSSATITGQESANGLISVGMADGSIDFYSPLFSQEAGWRLEKMATVSVSSSAVQSICSNMHDMGKQICVGCNDGGVFLIDISNLEKPEITELTKPGMARSEITHAAWNPKVTHIVSTSTASGHVIVWDIRQKTMWCELFDNNNSRISQVAWSPEDGLHLLTALDNDATPVMKLWDLRKSTSCPECEFSGHSKGILDLVWNRDDPSFVVSTGRDNKVLLWDMTSHSVLSDLAGGEEKPEVPRDAADFFTTVTRAASATCKTSVCWNPFNPAVIATAASDGMITLHSVEGASSAQRATPSSSQSTYSAVYGYENRFHGKVLSVTNLVRGDDLKEEIGRFETSMAGGDLRGYCEEMVGKCEDVEEQELWSFMKCMFDEDARTALIKHLGYSQTPIATPRLTPREEEEEQQQQQPEQQPVEEVKVKEDQSARMAAMATMTAEDLFASASLLATATPTELVEEAQEDVNEADEAAEAAEAAAVEEQQQVEGEGEKRVKVEVDPVFERALKDRVVVGDFMGAVEICFQYGRFTDALVVAAWGGAELVELATQRYTQEYASPLLGQLTAIVSGDLQDTIASTTLEAWQETLAMILTYAPTEDFTPLCQALAARMETLGAPDAALLCSICAVDIGSLLRLGLDRPVHGMRANLSVVEALLILCSMVTPAEIVLAETATSLAGKLAELCLQLQDQGMTSVTGFLNALRASPTAQPLLANIASVAPELLPGFVAPQPTPAPQPAAPVAATAQTLFSAPAPVPQSVQPMAPIIAPAAPAAFHPAPQPIAQPIAQPAAPVAPKPFMPNAQPAVAPIPAPQVAPMPMTTAPAERPRPAPFMPGMVTAPTPSAMPMVAPTPEPAPQPEPEPEVEYEITAEQQSVMDAIQATISMLSEAPLTAPQRAVVAKQQETLGVMATQFKKGKVSVEALGLLITLRDKLTGFDFVGAEDVYKKLNLDFWKVHKDWLLPLKHFLMLCKKMSS